MLLATLCHLTQLSEFAWDKRGLEKNDEKIKYLRESFWIWDVKLRNILKFQATAVCFGACVCHKW